MQSLLVAIGHRGKWVLPLGLLMAIALPAAAEPMRHAIAPLMLLLLVVSFLQLNSTLPQLFSNIRQSIWLVLAMQLLLPLLLLAAMHILSVPQHIQIPILLVASASSITGGPSVVMMLGGDGRSSIQLLLVSTVLLPLSVFPVFFLSPHFSVTKVVWQGPFLLFCMIALAWLLSALLRTYWLGPQTPKQKQACDGVAAILLAFVVIGLMSAIHTVWDKPILLFKTLLFATIVNVVLQMAGLLINRLFGAARPVMLGVMTGNRAVALFLAALPGAMMEPFLLFIACYQIPMYLTPLIGNYYYRTTSDA